jgi:small subunit ribosomal protein S1
MSPEQSASGPAGPTVVKRRARREGEDVPTAAAPSLDALLKDEPDLLGESEHTDAATEDPALDDASMEAVAADLNSEFARLLASGGRIADWKPGDRVRGTVVSITEDAVLVDIGAKSEAWMDPREFRDDDGAPTIKVGQDVEGQVLSTSGDAIRLSHGAVRAHQLSEMLQQAAETGLPVQGKVTGFNDGGLEVRIGSRRAFCPRSQIDLHFSNEPMDGHVGQTYDFLVTRFDPTGRKIVVSRRAILEREARGKAEETRKSLVEGAEFTGVVRKLMDFGVFVDVGGVDGLVHVSEVSWSRIEHPKDALKEGQEVRVRVLKVDPAKDRVSLSIRQAGEDPWSQLGSTFEQGKSYSGRITRLQPFGAFVELAPGLEGLVHVSEIDWNRRIVHPQDVLKVGDEATVLILEADRKKKRLALSIKQASGDPWALGVEGLAVGQQIEVTMEKHAEFGIFCTIAPGVTGLMPNSHTDKDRGSNLRREFPVGQKFQVTIIEIDRRHRKVTLSRKGDGGEEADFKAWQKEQRRTEKEQQSSNLSAFALAFQAAEAKRKK